MEGLLEAGQEVKPELPVFVSNAGAGEEEAIEMLKRRLAMDALPDMDAACKAAAEAATEAATDAAPGTGKGGA